MILRQQLRSFQQGIGTGGGGGGVGGGHSTAFSAVLPTLHWVTLDELRLVTLFSSPDGGGLAHSLGNESDVDDDVSKQFVFALFMPVWRLSDLATNTRLQYGLHLLASYGVRRAYAVMIKGGGSEDPVEDYVVDCLGLGSSGGLPGLAVYSTTSSSSSYSYSSDGDPSYRDGSQMNNSGYDSMLVSGGVIDNNPNPSYYNSNGIKVPVFTADLGGDVDVRSFEDTCFNNRRASMHMHSPFAHRAPHPIPAVPPLTTSSILQAFFGGGGGGGGFSDGTNMTLFIAGDKSQVGKSSVCYGILSTLVEVYGVDPNKLGYIKPVTQCESEQLITKYCNKVGIECNGIGPVVFYSGFTRSFLRGETADLEHLKGDVMEAVDTIRRGKVLTIIDGVGYPSVGSICGISNGDTAALLDSPVLLVGKSGVGDAVDSFNLNRTYFESFGVQVLGSVFNKLEETGYYNLQSCRESIDLYFDRFLRGYRVYGYIPVVKQPALISLKDAASSSNNSSSSNSSSSNSSSSNSSSSNSSSSSMMDEGKLSEHADTSANYFETRLTTVFSQSFDIGRLLLDVLDYQIHKAHRSIAASDSRRSSQENFISFDSGSIRSKYASANHSNSINSSSSNSNNSLMDGVVHGSDSRNMTASGGGASSNKKGRHSISNNSSTINNYNSNHNSNYNSKIDSTRKRTREEIVAEASRSGSCMT